MNKEILDRIDALAAKLGTTAEYMWPKLVWAQQVEGVLTLFGGGVLLLCSLYAARVFAAKAKAKLAAGKSGYPPDVDQYYVGCAAGLGVAVIAVSLRIDETMIFSCQFWGHSPIRCPILAKSV